MTKRIQIKRPGYDCVANPCGINGCGEVEDAGHGRHGDEWIYGVSDGEVAVTLVVFTHHFPSGPRPGLALDEVTPASHQIHASFATNEEQILAEKEKCEFVEGGCYSAARYTYAEGCWKSFGGRATFEQVESFWVEFERHFHAEASVARIARDELGCERCSHCNGKGIVATGPR